MHRFAAAVLSTAALFLQLEAGAVERLRAKVVSEYPHDPSAYTQGLFFHEGRLIESTGQYGASSLREVDLETGEVKTIRRFGRNFFAEGSVVFDGTLYVLTWQNHQLFAYDPVTLEYKSTYSYPREGWGLTTDGRSLIASDGSYNLYFLDEELKLTRTLKVTLNGRVQRYLNELEWIDGRIWANVYTTDTILVINPDTGVVEATLDCTGLLPRNLRTAGTDVLNGIALSEDGKIYLTGKNWPRLYEIKAVRQ